jgi:K+-sensing histidine kinase KdpD
VIVAAAAIPPLICLLLSGVRDVIENTNAALLLVLVVVGVAALCSRAAGLVAAVSGAAAFDYVLTAPYDQFRIGDRSDLETTVLLLLIGAAVTELALWGRRQQARASEQRGYLDGILQATDVLADAAPTATVIAHVESQLVDLLDLDSATYLARWSGDRPVLHPDGSVTRRRQTLDIDRTGLPTDTELVLPVRPGDPDRGAFRLVAATHCARPTAQQRRVAALLAERVALAEANGPAPSRETGADHR